MKRIWFYSEIPILRFSLNRREKMYEAGKHIKRNNLTLQLRIESLKNAKSRINV